MMKSFVLAPDSFKGTLDATELCDIWENAILAHIPDANVRRLPMADGGEGMVASYLSVMGGRRRAVSVSGPFGAPVDAIYGILPDGSAVMEMAACAGLPLVGERKDPMHATTYGVGEMIRHLAAQGVTNILIGIGGSATNDCGIGMAAAFGYRFLDVKRIDVEPLAGNMGRIRHIVKPPFLPDLSVTVACDVVNPLYGPNGATYTYGRQKGVDENMQPVLDAGLKNIAAIVKNDLKADVANLPGAGAAGGLGAGLVAFLGAKLVPGIEMFLDAVGFDRILVDTDIVLTGEGCIDAQSIYGKVPVGVATRAKAAKVPCIALCGSIGPGAEAVYDYGITAMFSSVCSVSDFESIKKTCRGDMALLADAVVRLIIA